MLQEQFIHTIKNPNLLSELQIAELEAIVREYPFFETAHLLYTKGLQKQNSLLFAIQLRKTAIIANSRVILHELLHKKELIVEKKEISKTQEVLETKDTIIGVNEVVKSATVNVNTTDSSLKVIHFNIIQSENNNDYNIRQKQAEDIPIVSAKSNEIEILQHIENETESKQFDIDKLNKTIEHEISRGIIQSFVETDILKTQELNKIETIEPVSFTDWLLKIKKEAHTIQKQELISGEKVDDTFSKQNKNVEKSNFFSQNRHLIDKIIESDPGRLKLSTNKFFTPNSDAKQSLLENEHLVTETLAKIYALQGNNNKAIRAYEILSLKFPQKSAYFAILIQNLKNNK